MSEFEPLRKAFEDMHKATGEVGKYMSTALQQVAAEQGGAEFGVLVADLSHSMKSPFPDAEALKFLNDSYPGSAELVMARTKEIQEETHRQELEELRRHRLRRYGKMLLRGFEMIGEGMSYLTISPHPRPRKRK